MTPPPPLEAFQAFDGTAFVGGQQLPLVVELRATGPSDATASLLIPDLSLEAHGKAMVRQDRLTLDLRYEGTCAGEARIEARMESGGRRASGTLQATDCTGQESGTIVLMRRSP